MSNLGFAGEQFTKVFYFAHGGSGDNSGESADNALPIADADLMTIPAGTVVEKCYAIIDTAVEGTTDFDVGDDDDGDGFIDGSVSLTIGTEGLYGWSAKTAGDYLRVETAGATDAGDIDVVANAKYYSVGTKTLSIDVTGASSAGVFRVVLQGTKLAS